MLYIMLQILKITFSKNHDIKGCIIMGHNCAKFAHVTKNRIFLEIWLNWFFSSYFALSCGKVSNEIAGADPAAEVCIILVHNQVKIAHLIRKTFSGNFTEDIFI